MNINFPLFFLFLVLLIVLIAFGIYLVVSVFTRRK